MNQRTLSRSASCWKPTLDPQSGKHYLSFSGHDAFGVAKLVPEGLVEFVTMRQDTSSHALHDASAKIGTYAHDNVEIVVERNDFHDGMGPRSLMVYVTGKSVDRVQGAYRLFREGKLPLQRWHESH